IVASSRAAHCHVFLSSRRRHTRFKCDWSSDVCSSDLHCRVGWSQLCRAGITVYGVTADGGHAEYLKVPARTLVPLPAELSFIEEIGRASCRERASREVGAGALGKQVTEMSS